MKVMLYYLQFTTSTICKICCFYHIIVQKIAPIITISLNYSHNKFYNCWDNILRLVYGKNDVKSSVKIILH